MRLAFLKLRAKDDETDPSHFAGRFTVDIKDPAGTNNRLTFAELAGGPDFDKMIDAAFTGDANVNLDLDLGSGRRRGLPADARRLRPGLVVRRCRPGCEPDRSAIARELPSTISGSIWAAILDNVIGPLVHTIDSALDPIRPVLDVLNTRLPVLSDLGPTRALLDTNGDGSVTLLEMASLIGNGADTAATFISALSNVVDVADILDRLSAAGDTALLDFGSFDLGSIDVRGLTDLTGAAPNVTRATDPLDQFTNSGSADQREAAKKLTASPGGGFVFPIIENPSSLFGLLMGKDVALVGYDMPAVNVSMPYSQFFPLIGPLGITLAGSVNLDLDLAFGFDSFGARRFADAGFDPSKTALILDGLFISDTGKADGSGKDVDEVTLQRRDRGVRQREPRRGLRRRGRRHRRDDRAGSERSERRRQDPRHANSRTRWRRTRSACSTPTASSPRESVRSSRSASVSSLSPSTSISPRSRCSISRSAATRTRSSRPCSPARAATC